MPIKDTGLYREQVLGFNSSELFRSKFSGWTFTLYWFFYVYKFFLFRRHPPPPRPPRAIWSRYVPVSLRLKGSNFYCINSLWVLSRGLLGGFEGVLFPTLNTVDCLSYVVRSNMYVVCSLSKRKGIVKRKEGDLGTSPGFVVHHCTSLSQPRSYYFFG